MSGILTLFSFLPIHYMLYHIYYFPHAIIPTTLLAGSNPPPKKNPKKKTLPQKQVLFGKKKRKTFLYIYCFKPTFSKRKIIFVHLFLKTNFFIHLIQLLHLTYRTNESNKKIKCPDLQKSSAPNMFVT